MNRQNRSRHRQGDRANRYAEKNKRRHVCRQETELLKQEVAELDTKVGHIKQRISGLPLEQIVDSLSPKEALEYIDAKAHDMMLLVMEFIANLFDHFQKQGDTDGTEILSTYATQCFRPCNEILAANLALRKCVKRSRKREYERLWLGVAIGLTIAGKQDLIAEYPEAEKQNMLFQAEAIANPGGFR